MARQESFLKLKGRVGDLTFYKSGSDYLARTKGGIDGDRIKNDPQFARTRENGQEFLRAVKAGKLLRDAFREQLNQASDRLMNGRLTSVFSKVVKSDTTSARGDRTVSAGDTSLLKGFEFNNNSNLENVFSGEYGVNFAENIAEASIEAFNPSLNIQSPDGATHAQFVMAAGTFDFSGLTSAVAKAESTSVDLSASSQDALTLTADASGVEGGIGIVILGILFWQQVNGELYKINNGAKNALRIVAVA
jgi:hypothetical protein